MNETNTIQHSAEQMQELQTNDTRYSRSRYLNFLGATIGNQETGVPCNGEICVDETISRFNDGMLHGAVGVDGEQNPAIEMTDGHTEWWSKGLLHRDNKPAVITNYGTWEEWWYHGKLTLIRAYGRIEFVIDEGE